MQYRLATVNSKSFISKVFNIIKWNLELPMFFKHEMIVMLLIIKTQNVQFKLNLEFTVFELTEKVRLYGSNFR